MSQVNNIPIITVMRHALRGGRGQVRRNLGSGQRSRRSRGTLASLSLDMSKPECLGSSPGPRVFPPWYEVALSSLAVSWRSIWDFLGNMMMVDGGDGMPEIFCLPFLIMSNSYIPSWEVSIGIVGGTRNVLFCFGKLVDLGGFGGRSALSALPFGSPNSFEEQ